MELTESLIGGFIAVFAYKLLTSFLTSYSTQKAKNRAQIEDVPQITNKEEEIRSRYAANHEVLKTRHQLRIAAIDRRLQSHQDAFTYWRNLTAACPRSDKAFEAVIACQDWWEKNCLYLEPDVREAFFVAYKSALLRVELLRVGGDTEQITDAWNKVIAFPDILFPAINLPRLSDLELGETKKTKNDNESI